MEYEKNIGCENVFLKFLVVSCKIKFIVIVENINFQRQTHYWNFQNNGGDTLTIVIFSPHCEEDLGNPCFLGFQLECRFLTALE